MKDVEKSFEKIVAMAKNRGFVFAGSEIYGGLANTWDYGPLGVELKNNVKKAWWQKFITEQKNVVGLDSSILMNKDVWIASGHVGGFSDPLMDCKECKERFRADKIIEDDMFKKGIDGVADGMTNEEMVKYIEDNKLVCPSCGEQNYTDIREFNLMFKTSAGVTEDSKNTIYLRPETAQGIFVNFKNVQRTTRKKIPFGIGQIGKSFRNEITPGNFIFRTREFEQMEMEFFCEPDTIKEWHKYWKDFCFNWLLSLGIKEENIRMREHGTDELSHYSESTADIEYKFPFGFGELWGIADRGNFDLKSHQESSKVDLTYFDQEKNEKYLPHVIEPALGLDRAVLAFLFDAYDEEEIGENDTRIVLRFSNALAPIKVGILPLSKKLSDEAVEIFNTLSKNFTCEFDETGSIGKRYRRFDEIGTPYCITYDFESREDNTVTIRDRDTMEQVRVAINELEQYFIDKMKF